MKTIGIIALSGCVVKEKLNNAKLNLEKIGFKVKLSENIFYKKRYFSGEDEDKLKALSDLFQDPEIDIIMCARGGYGAIRLLNHIDYNLIKNNQKVFCGFSDVTALLLMIYKKTGMITYHGPMACSDFGCENGYDFSLEYFEKAISRQNLEFEGNKIYTKGSAEGIIWGGNLATVVSLCGLDFIPDEDFIFFAEDLNEPVYKIDRMFTQLFNIEKFRANCKGVVLGDFLYVDNQDWLDELFHEFSIPAVGGFKITHNQEKVTIPVGARAVLSGMKLVVNKIS